MRIGRYTQSSTSVPSRIQSAGNGSSPGTASEPTGVAWTSASQFRSPIRSHGSYAQPSSRASASAFAASRPTIVTAAFVPFTAVAAVRAAGLPVEYLVKEDEGHGFHNEENQFDFYRCLESFLREHLGLSSA